MLLHRMNGWLLLALLLLCVAPVVEASALRVCLPDLEIVPFLLRSPHAPGLVERILHESARRAGLTLTIRRAPTKRCALDFEQGRVDSMMMSWNPMTQAIGRFPMQGSRPDIERRVARIPMVWAQRKQAPIRWEGSRATGGAGEPVVIGTLRTFPVLSEPLREQGYRVEDSSFTVHQLLLQLRARRTDAAIAMADQLQRELMEGGFDDLELLPQTLIKVDYYAAVNRATWSASARQIEAWWQAMSQVREAMTAAP